MGRFERGVRRIFLPGWAALALVLFPPGLRAQGSIKGVVESLSGTRLAGAEIRIKGKDAATWAEGPAGRLSGPDGAFVFDNLPPGDYVVCAGAAGYAPSWGEVKVEGAHTLPSLYLTLTEGGNVAGTVDETLVRPGSPPRVELVCKRTGLRFESGLDATGAFRLTRVTPGEYRLALRFDREPAALVPAVSVFEGRTTLVELDAGARLQQEERPAKPAAEIPRGEGGLELVVTDDAGAAVKKAIVLFIPDEEPRRSQRIQKTTNAKGGVVLEGLLPGLYHIAVRKAGFRLAVSQGAVAPGRRTRLAIKMERGTDFKRVEP